MRDYLIHQNLLPALSTEYLNHLDDICRDIRSSFWGFKAEFRDNFIYVHSPIRLYLYHMLVFRTIYSRNEMYRHQHDIWTDFRYRGSCRESLTYDTFVVLSRGEQHIFNIDTYKNFHHSMAYYDIISGISRESENNIVFNDRMLIFPEFTRNRFRHDLNLLVRGFIGKAEGICPEEILIMENIDV